MKIHLIYQQLPERLHQLVGELTSQKRIIIFTSLLIKSDCNFQPTEIISAHGIEILKKWKVKFDFFMMMKFANRRSFNPDVKLISSHMITMNSTWSAYAHYRRTKSFEM